jgi:hypothetical protein
LAPWSDSKAPVLSSRAKNRKIGGMAEWLKAAVLKTVEAKAFVGSNPTPSANEH